MPPFFNVPRFSILLTCGTFLIAYSLNRFRHSRYFTFRVFFAHLAFQFPIFPTKIDAQFVVRLWCAHRHCVAHADHIFDRAGSAEPENAGQHTGQRARPHFPQF